MRILVDSCVGSAVPRRGSLGSDPVRIEMVRLVEGGCVELIGPVRQEILSGARTESQFEAPREALDDFPEIAVRSEDFVEAARLYSLCRGHGIQGSGTDFVICAVAIREDIPVFTSDSDFGRYAQVFPLRLHRAGSRDGGPPSNPQKG